MGHRRTSRTKTGEGRERVLRTAYELFRRDGINTVGVDRVVAEADVAKTTLYRHFPSKDDLAVSVLERHEVVWTKDWLERAVRRHGGSAGERLLTIFDAFDGWFRRKDYEGCLFARTLLETRDPASPVHAAAAAGLVNIRAFIRGLAKEAGARDADLLALQIQMLLLGAIVEAVSGERDAALKAREAARLLLEREGITVRT